ncbi:hypothetical protein FJU30_21510 [Affinibrenneria salicis]|uniref:Fimbrial assembly protein n=1 Tax=Affinibrenneria salicis TaxID=2590031 RepID=A0A5J5FTK9_9GAMM|nr:PilN domain-containing protein [Affinibrenneria salicis]KAA8996373.1 hypothetical protein FJU30_21510 [Affinibrenneria salicis]
MVQVNFLPWRQNRLRRQKRHCFLLLLGQMLLVAGGFALLFLSCRQQQQALSRTLDGLSRQQQSTVGLYQQRRECWQKIQRHQLRQAEILASQQHNQRYQALLAQLPVLVSSRLWLTSLQERDQRLSLNGGSDAYDAIVAFSEALAAYPALNNIRLETVSRAAPSTEDARPLHFALQAMWRSTGASSPNE